MIAGLIAALQHHKIKVSLVQASRVRQFARASGIWAKTDRIDAAVLCAFGEAIKPAVLAAPRPIPAGCAPTVSRSWRTGIPM